MAASSSSRSAGNKMDDSDHATTHDIENLATSLTEKIETLYPLSQDCCIYRVPQPLWCLNPSAYTPKTVSIGPYHHGKEELNAMEEHKIRFLRHFLQRTKASIKQFLSFIKDKEANLRDCYAETIKLESDEFVRMILVDAVFVIEILLRRYKTDLITDDDRMVLNSLWSSDIFLMENQLPLFILNDLFNLAKTASLGGHYEGLSLITIIIPALEIILEFPQIEENYVLENHYKEARHLLDLMRLCLQPSLSPPQTKYEPQGLPTATELYRAGVKFKFRPSTNLFCITFNKGILEIPRLKIFRETSCLFRNLQVFETFHSCDTHYVNDYVSIMNSLANTKEDVELLIQNEVIEICISDYAEVSPIFHDLVKGNPIYLEFQYSNLVKDLKAYCRRPWHRWKAILKQNYFNNPWASISVGAAVILLVLTFIQTVCSIIAV